MENEEKNEKNLDNFAKNLENEFKNFGENDGKNAEKTENTSIGSSFVCPNFVLDFLQDKPTWLQKSIICKNFGTDQIKEVEYIFKPSADELTIARQVIKKYIEKLVNAYPEVEKYLSEESVFLGSWGISFHERRKLVIGHIGKKETENA